jgi:hypothetical protein
MDVIAMMVRGTRTTQMDLTIGTQVSGPLARHDVLWRQIQWMDRYASISHMQAPEMIACSPRVATHAQRTLTLLTA